MSNPLLPSLGTAGPPAREVAVVVDGYTTGNFLPKAFEALGVQVAHVQSSAELISTVPAPALTDYLANYVCADPAQVDSTCSALRQLRPVAVLAGQEPGVPLADLLSERLGLATNGSAKSHARRDKFAMIEALRAAGLRCARQYKSSTAAGVTAWADRNGEFPVVVKPLSSASTDHVAICASASEVAAAADAVLASKDIFGSANTEVLVQSYLPGTEYIVDTVSVDGKHFVCGVWQYDKRTVAGGRRIYDRDVLLSPGIALVPELSAYTDAVLEVLGIRHGPAHAEVIVTPEGPALVEIGARLNGNMNPGFHDICLGTNQADLTALCYARPDEFLTLYAGRTYSKLQSAVVHNTITTREGIIDDVDEKTIKAIAALPSVHRVSVKLSPGHRMQPTVDLLTSPLRIFMTASDSATIEDDYQTIQELKEHVYRLRSTPSPREQT